MTENRLVKSLVNLCKLSLRMLPIRACSLANFALALYQLAETHSDTPYDYNSILHYSAYAFSKNNLPTIRKKRSGPRLDQRRGFSRMDLLEINKLYQCSNSSKQQSDNREQQCRELDIYASIADV